MKEAKCILVSKEIFIQEFYFLQNFHSTDPLGDFDFGDVGIRGSLGRRAEGVWEGGGGSVHGMWSE